MECRELLDAAARMLNQGGVLVYCTCSLEMDEGERQIERFLAYLGSVLMRRALACSVSAT